MKKWFYKTVKEQLECKTRTVLADAGRDLLSVVEGNQGSAWLFDLLHSKKLTPVGMHDHHYGFYYIFTLDLFGC